MPNIYLFHLTLLVALLFVGDWMTLTPYYRAHPFHRGGGAGYHCSIVSSTYHYISYFTLRYLIWSSFQYLILTCNLFLYTCFSCLKSTFFILSYQLHCCWLDDPHPFPGPTHSTGGRGGDVMTMTMAGGVGGGPGTWNIYRLKMRKQPNFAGNDFGAWPEPIDSWDLYFETHLYSNVSPLPSVPCNFSTCNVAEAISCGQSWLQATPGFSKSNNHIQQVEHETWIQKNSFEEVTKPLKSKDSLPNLSSSVGVRCLFVLRTSPVGSQPECPPCT